VSDDPFPDLDVALPGAVLVVLALAIGVALFVGASTSATAFGAYNPAWDGTAEFRTLAAEGGTTVTVARETERYDGVDREGTVAVVLSPGQPYTAAELDSIRSFVREGGTLLVAEDFGPRGNGLLAGVGTDARVDGRLLRDERANYRTPAMPVATDITDHPMTRGVRDLALNHGTAVRPGDARVLVNTSEYAYLDANRSGDIDDDERVGRYPVVTTEDVGDGRVVVVGDPSVFLNAMLEREGSSEFARRTTATERVVVDVSHTERVPPLAALGIVLDQRPWLQFLLGAVAVAGALAVAYAPGGNLGRLPGVAGRGANRRDGPVMERAELAAYLRERHDDWDERTIERITQGIMMGRDERSDDD
jgi:hypothetical protein